MEDYPLDIWDEVFSQLGTRRDANMFSTLSKYHSTLKEKQSKLYQFYLGAPNDKIYFFKDYQLSKYQVEMLNFIHPSNFKHHSLNIPDIDNMNYIAVIYSILVAESNKKVLLVCDYSAKRVVSRFEDKVDLKELLYVVTPVKYQTSTDLPDKVDLIVVLTLTFSKFKNYDRYVGMQAFSDITYRTSAKALQYYVEEETMPVWVKCLNYKTDIKDVRGKTLIITNVGEKSREKNIVVLNTSTSRLTQFTYDFLEPFDNIVVRSGLENHQVSGILMILMHHSNRIRKLYVPDFSLLVPSKVFIANKHNDTSRSLSNVCGLSYNEIFRYSKTGNVSLPDYKDRSNWILIDPNQEPDDIPVCLKEPGFNLTVNLELKTLLQTDKFTLEELKKLCLDRGLTSSGDKEMLTKRLLATL